MEDYVPNVQQQWKIVSNVQKEPNVKHLNKHIIQIIVVVQHLFHKDEEMIAILVIENVLNVQKDIIQMAQYVKIVQQKKTVKNVQQQIIDVQFVKQDIIQLEVNV